MSVYRCVDVRGYDEECDQLQDRHADLENRRHVVENAPTRPLEVPRRRHISRDQQHEPSEGVELRRRFLCFNVRSTAHIT